MFTASHLVTLTWRQGNNMDDLPVFRFVVFSIYTLHEAEEKNLILEYTGG